MLTFIKTVLWATSWPMERPVPYSAFHILLCVAGVTASVYLARRLSSPKHRPVPILFTCGLILAVIEIYKQAFLYFIVNGGQYDWWYFPFQLCSVPMYLCLSLPLFKGPKMDRAKGRVCTFMQDFAMLGGIMALAEPSGLMHPYLLLTLHGFLWHFMLIFIGLYCAQAGLTGKNRRDFWDVLPMFFICALIATFINVASHPYGNADMFYISPYYPNGQIVFRQIALTIGTTAGNLLYLGSVVLGGFIFHCTLSRIMRNSRI